MLSSAAWLLMLAPVGQAVPPPAPAAHPMDEPLRLLEKAQQAFATVQDYSCTMIKQERLGGTLSQPQIITLMVKQQPFSVYMKWHQPKTCVGQEACYVEGKNNGQMRVRSAGILGSVGFVSVDPTDPRAKKTSNHLITESGLSNLMNRFQDRWASEKKFNRVLVKVGEYEYNKRRCTRVETAYRENVPGAPFYRGVVYFDKELSVPIRVELYDWPRSGAPAGGELIETYSYINLKLNVNLPADTFNK